MPTTDIKMITEEECNRRMRILDSGEKHYLGTGTNMYAFTEQEYAKAFAEWDRRFKNNPEEFYYPADHTPEEYGMASAKYFLTLLGIEP